MHQDRGVTGPRGDQMSATESHRKIFYYRVRLCGCVRTILYVHVHMYYVCLKLIHLYYHSIAE